MSRTTRAVLCQALSDDIGSVSLQAVDAMRLLENREVIGKAVVTMNGYDYSAQLTT